MYGTLPILSHGSLGGQHFLQPPHSFSYSKKEEEIILPRFALQKVKQSHAIFFYQLCATAQSPRLDKALSLFSPPLHLLEVSTIISLFGLLGITGPRGTFHFYFSGFQLIDAH